MLSVVTQALNFVSARSHVAWPLVVGILPPAIIGIVVGAHMLKELDSAYIQLVASAVVIGFALLLLRGAVIGLARSHGAVPITGFLAGALGASVGMNGPPLIILASARDISRDVMRGTLTVIFLLIAVLSLAHLYWHDLIIRSEIEDALILIPSAIIGTEIGKYCSRRVAPEHFRRMLLGILIASGVIGGTQAVSRLFRV